MRRFAGLLTGLLLLTPLVGAQEGIRAPGDPQVLAYLLNNPQALRSDVVSLHRNGRDWCGIRADFQAVYPVSLDRFLQVVTDYEHYPQIFSKIRTSEVERKGDVVTQTETVVVSVFGIDFKSRFTIRLTQREEPTPRRVVVSWEQVSADDSIDGVKGFWYLEEIPANGRSLVYVRYRTESDVPRTILGQEGIMGLFLAGDIKDVLQSVVRAIR